VGASGGFRLLRLLDSFSCPRLCTYNQLVTRRGSPSLPACCRHYPSYYRNPNSNSWRALPGFNGQEKQVARPGSPPQPRLATPITRKSNACRKRFGRKAQRDAATLECALGRSEIFGFRSARAFHCLAHAQAQIQRELVESSSCYVATAAWPNLNHRSGVGLIGERMPVANGNRHLGQSSKQGGR
jgi:hypothetical protein